jgi:hypothetical protein
VDDVDALLDRLRPEDLVASPEALRAAKATRLSFARSLVARMVRERWRIELCHIELDDMGAGRLIYSIDANGRTMHFGVHSFRPQEFEWAGRIADAGFDFLGAILDGPLDMPRMMRELDELTTKMWVGRTDNVSYGWTAANRSNRFFDHTVECLSEGRQPDVEYLASGGGYIIRNAGWHGNGRFGSRSWLSLGTEHPLGRPYHLDLFPLYLLRLVGFDVAEAVARIRNPSGAVPLSPSLKRVLGIGNSSGVGMVAALVRWPVWLSAYNFPRELALAFALSRPGPVDRSRALRLCELLRRAAVYYSEQPDCPVEEIERPERIAAALRSMAELAGELGSHGTLEGTRPEYPWAALSEIAARSGSGEIREQVHAMLVELYPDFSDAAGQLFADAMKIRRTTDPEMPLARLRALIRTRYDWALGVDQAAPGARAHFWYRSEEHGENRRGERDVDPGTENETFVDVVGAVQSLERELAAAPAEMSVGRFLMQHPEHAHVVSRVQLSARLPYTEIRGNIIDRDFLPMDGIRFLLSMMGLECSHPHNTRWVRGVFLQGAPTPDDIRSGEGSDWIFPSLRQIAV